MRIIRAVPTRHTRPSRNVPEPVPVEVAYVESVNGGRTSGDPLAYAERWQALVELGGGSEWVLSELPDVRQRFPEAAAATGIKEIGTALAAGRAEELGEEAIFEGRCVGDYGG